MLLDWGNNRVKCMLIIWNFYLNVNKFLESNNLVLFVSNRLSNSRLFILRIVAIFFSLKPKTKDKKQSQSQQ